VYPVTDADCDTGSFSEHAEGYTLTADTMHWFWDHYAPENAQRNDPRASPAKRRDLAGLPPALVITAQYDPLCDEGEAYGAALRAAGVPTEIERYDGVPHSFFALVRQLPCGQPAMDRACAALAAAFAR
jgi:acetyl esterase